MRGFCFSVPGKELDISRPDPGSDFFVFLSDYCQREGYTEVAMTLEDMQASGAGVADLLKYGINVIVVDQAYSPVTAEKVLPVWVHRNVNTLPKHHPEAVVVGSLIPLFHKQRLLASVKAYFQDGVPAYAMDIFKSGWVVRSKTGSEARLSSCLYEYDVTRDYELENSNAKRKSPKR